MRSPLRKTILAATLVICGCHNPSTNPASGPTGTRQYQNTDLGIRFTYPASWKADHEQHVLLELTGPNHCAVNIVDMLRLDGKPVGSDAAALQHDLLTGDPGGQPATRPPWAGQQAPAATFALLTREHGTSVLEYDTLFDGGHDAATNGEYDITLTEQTLPGDPACAAGLQQVETTFRLSPPAS